MFRFVSETLQVNLEDHDIDMKESNLCTSSDFVEQNYFSTFAENVDILSEIFSFMTMKDVSKYVMRVSRDWNKAAWLSLKEVEFKSPKEWKLVEDSLTHLNRIQTFMNKIVTTARHLKTFCIDSEKSITSFRNEYLKKLAETCGESLQKLELKGAKMITMQNGISHILHKMPHLIHIDLTGVFFLDDEYVSLIAQRFPNLQYLNISKCFSISDVGYSHIMGLKKLKTLKMNYCGLITFKALLLSMEETDRVRTSGSPHENRNLRELQIVETGISSLALLNICFLYPNLHTLALGGHLVVDKPVHHYVVTHHFDDPITVTDKPELSFSPTFFLYALLGNLERVYHENRVVKFLGDNNVSGARQFCRTKLKKVIKPNHMDINIKYNKSPPETRLISGETLPQAVYRTGLIEFKIKLSDGTLSK